jgi:hypothetical protein
MLACLLPVGNIMCAQRAPCLVYSLANSCGWMLLILCDCRRRLIVGAVCTTSSTAGAVPPHCVLCKRSCPNPLLGVCAVIAPSPVCLCETPCLPPPQLLVQPGRVVGGGCHPKGLQDQVCQPLHIPQLLCQGGSERTCRRSKGTAKVWEHGWNAWNTPLTHIHTHTHTHTHAHTHTHTHTRTHTTHTHTHTHTHAHMTVKQPMQLKEPTPARTSDLPCGVLQTWRCAGFGVFGVAYAVPRLWVINPPTLLCACSSHSPPPPLPPYPPTPPYPSPVADLVGKR